MRIQGVALAGVLAMCGTAWAHPPPPDDYYIAAEPAKAEKPVVEWSTWVRVAYGAAPAPVEARPRVTSPVGEPDGRDQGWETAGGIDATIGVGDAGRVRIGPWAEVRTSSDAVVGGELMIAGAPRKLDMFWYEGEGVLIARLGRNREIMTAAVSYGYRAPWKLWGPWRGKTRYMIGVRVVGSWTRAVENPELWSATVGLETEPVGALRYLLGIRSWY
ncbi:MAG TPA: hypothetical protein VM261_09135 [Kofleriaceae bacterium]|nr:hypothetical protein [Kofleriaceae bacterium]